MSTNGMSFAPSEEQRMLRELAHEFAVKEIVPVAEHYDRTAEFPKPILDKAREIGLLNLNIPLEYGGQGLSVLDECIISEELAWGCSGIATSMNINNLAALPILISGSEEQKKEWLGRLTSGGQLAAYAVTEPGAGSDVAGIGTVAERRGGEYVLRGCKTFISNASHADFYVTFAYTAKELKYKGISAFIVERERQGLSVSKKFDKLGQRASDTAEISLDDVVVPESHRLGKEGDGFMIAMSVFDRSRPVVGAGAVGVARRALEESVKYAKVRKAFGAELINHQAIGHKLADMAMNIEAARLLCWQAAWMVDHNQPAAKYAAFAKAFAADAAMKITIEAVQVLGGYGYIKEFPVEKLMRDVKVYQIYEGTSEIQRNIIARELAR